MWPKNMWKRIPHLMQRHGTSRKSYKQTHNSIEKKLTKFDNSKQNDWLS